MIYYCSFKLENSNFVEQNQIKSKFCIQKKLALFLTDNYYNKYFRYHKSTNICDILLYIMSIEKKYEIWAVWQITSIANISDITNLQISVIFLLYIIWIEKKYEICFWQITNLRKSTSAPEPSCISLRIIAITQWKIKQIQEYEIFPNISIPIISIFKYISITLNVLIQFRFLMLVHK